MTLKKETKAVAILGRSRNQAGGMRAEMVGAGLWKGRARGRTGGTAGMRTHEPISVMTEKTWTGRLVTKRLLYLCPLYPCQKGIKPLRLRCAQESMKPLGLKGANASQKALLDGNSLRSFQQTAASTSQ